MDKLSRHDAETKIRLVLKFAHNVASSRSQCYNTMLFASQFCGDGVISPSHVPTLLIVAVLLLYYMYPVYLLPSWRPS